MSEPIEPGLGAATATAARMAEHNNGVSRVEIIAAGRTSVDCDAVSTD